MKLERITQFTPAFDKRNDVPSKNYGIGSMRCFMIVRGKEGCTHFVFGTGIFLDSTMNDYIKDGRAKYEMHSFGNYYLNKPMGYDVGYHSKKPQFKGQELRHPTKIIYPKKPTSIDEGMKDPKKYLNQLKFKKVGKLPVCEWLGVPCYCDGSAMRAETAMNLLIEKGSDAVWKMLEDDYKSMFKK